MARTNLHESASDLLACLDAAATSGTFEGKLRTLQAEAGLSSGRSAEALKLLEHIGRIEVVQRGRRSRDTIIKIASTEPVTIEEAESLLPSRSPKRAVRIDPSDIGTAVVDRLIELGRNDALRSAQVDAFESEARQARTRIQELEAEVAEAGERETQLRVRLRAAEEALERAEENLRRAFSPGGAPVREDRELPDADTRAVLDILRSGGQ